MKYDIDLMAEDHHYTGEFDVTVMAGTCCEDMEIIPDLELDDWTKNVIKSCVYQSIANLGDKTPAGLIGGHYGNGLCSVVNNYVLKKDGVIVQEYHKQSNNQPDASSSENIQNAR